MSFYFDIHKFDSECAYMIIFYFSFWHSVYSCNMRSFIFNIGVFNLLFL